MSQRPGPLSRSRACRRNIDNDQRQWPTFWSHHNSLALFVAMCLWIFNGYFIGHIEFTKQLLSLIGQFGYTASLRLWLVTSSTFSSSDPYLRNSCLDRELMSWFSCPIIIIITMDHQVPIKSRKAFSPESFAIGRFNKQFLLVCVPLDICSFRSQRLLAPQVGVGFKELSSRVA